MAVTLWWLEILHTLKAAVHTARNSADNLPQQDAVSVALSQRACKAAEQKLSTLLAGRLETAIFHKK